MYGCVVRRLECPLWQHSVRSAEQRQTEGVPESIARDRTAARTLDGSGHPLPLAVRFARPKHPRTEGFRRSFLARGQIGLFHIPAEALPAGIGASERRHRVLANR